MTLTPPRLAPDARLSNASQYLEHNDLEFAYMWSGVSRRLLGEHAVHDSSVDVKNKMHDTAAGNPSISTDTAHSDSGAHEDKPSIGERIKGTCISS